MNLCMERRVFFKLAAQRVLPLIGLVILQQGNIFAVQKPSNGFNHSCENSCSNSCITMCHEDACKSGCYGGCRQTCMKTCADLCIGNCKGSCLNSCMDLGKKDSDTCKIDTLKYK